MGPAPANHNPMRILVWNLNHRAACHPIPEWIAGAIGAQDPDVIVLTEYVEGDDHNKFLSSVAALGLESWDISPKTSRQNQVLIASRHRLQRGTLAAPSLHKSVPPNALHVVLEDSGLNVLGFRMPAFEGKERPLKRDVWQWLLSAAEILRVDASVIAGDFNTAPGDSVTTCGDCLEQLSRSGWQHVLPSSGFSWKHARYGTRRQLDHIFFSPALPPAHADYLWGFQSLAADAASGKVGIPDHAILLATCAQSYSGIRGLD